MIGWLLRMLDRWRRPEPVIIEDQEDEEPPRPNAQVINPDHVWRRPEEFSEDQLWDPFTGRRSPW